MGITTNSTERDPRRSRRRLAAATAAIALVATGAVGAQSFAGEGEVDPGPLPPAGEPIIPDAPNPVEDSAIGSDTLVQTGGANFDPTILTKFLPAAAFDPLQGSATNANDDQVLPASGSCLRPDTVEATGENTFLKAPVELPDGARIKRIVFFGADGDATRDISITLHRQEFTSELNVAPLPPTIDRTNTVVDAFSTSGSDGDVILAGADDLEELTGTPFTGAIPLDNPTRFHTVEVVMQKSAAASHVLCGVRVDYQVAVPADPGTVFHPLDPVRVFDSRLDVLPESGRLGPNETKVIDISDGYDSAGAAIPAQENAVPASATAVAYNITIAAADGPNFVAVTAGDAASFTASAINYSAGSNVANGSSVTIADDRTIKLWGGNNTGSSHILIDIVGFYSPPIPPNMAN